MKQEVVAVTGANGQLGRELQELASSFPAYRFIFASKEDLPIDDVDAVANLFAKHKPVYLVNCAAYTAVDKAEVELEIANRINGEAVGFMAHLAAENNCRFIHVSTDYVFDGNSPHPYKEDDITSPVNAYGASKLLGERLCVEANPKAIIIRTAWVYSEFQNNFVKTMLRLMTSRPEVKVVSDQVGAPTYAADLARAIQAIITSGKWVPGIYHYSNKGKISWYDFAVAISQEIKTDCKVTAIPTTEYPTPAKRPAFSLLDTTKIQKVYNVEIPDWRESLRLCLRKISK